MSAGFTPTYDKVTVATLKEALGHAMAALRCLADYAEPEELLDDPEGFGGTDDGVETLSMAYDNMRFAAERGVARVEQCIQRGLEAGK